jgi:hypothetical protein
MYPYQKKHCTPKRLFDAVNDVCCAFCLEKKSVGHNRGVGFCFAVTNRTVSAAHSLQPDNVKRLNLVQYKRQQGYIEEENARCLYMGDGDSAELYEKRPRLANTVWQRVYTTTRLPRDLSPATSSINCHKERERVLPMFSSKAPCHLRVLYGSDGAQEIR